MCVLQITLLPGGFLWTRFLQLLFLFSTETIWPGNRTFENTWQNQRCKNFYLYCFLCKENLIVIWDMLGKLNFYCFLTYFLILSFYGISAFTFLNDISFGTATIYLVEASVCLTYGLETFHYSDCVLPKKPAKENVLM